MTAHKVGDRPGDGHDLAARLRLRTAYLHDRRGPVPGGRREGHRVPARAPAATSTQARAIVYWYHAHRRSRRAERAEDPRLRVRRRLRGDPGLRADLRARPARPRPTGSPAIRRSGRTSTRRSILFEQYFHDPDARRLLLARRPDHVRSASASRWASNRARKNWNSVGDHAPAYLINLWLATGEQKYADMLVDTADTIEQRFPDYDEQPVRPGEVLRGLVPRQDLGLAAESRRSSGTT